MTCSVFSFHSVSHTFRELPTFPSQLSSDLVEDLLVNVDAFIFDADGVLWLGNTPIPGSPEFIKYLLSKVWLLSYLWSISGSKFFAVLAVAEKCLSFVNGALVKANIIKKKKGEDWWKVKFIKLLNFCTFYGRILLLLFAGLM